MPCSPRRDAVPLNQGYCKEDFSLSIPFLLSVMAATAPAMSQEFGTTPKAFKAFHSFAQPATIASERPCGYVPKIVTISRIWRFCGRARPSFQAFTIDVAIRILSARWYGAILCSWSLIWIQSAIVFTLAGNGLGCGGFLVFCVNLTEIWRYAKPISATLLHFMEERELCARFQG